MLSTLISLNLTMTLMFVTLTHPLSMGAILLTQTITISLITGNMNQNLWFSYILFLIMIGGMLILFMYMTSIASNEKFKINFKIMLATIMVPIIMMMTKTMSNSLTMNNEMIETNKTIELSSSINKFINLPLTPLLMFMIIYLLLALIATVKITEFKQGSMRQMN